MTCRPLGREVAQHVAEVWYTRPVGRFVFETRHAPLYLQSFPAAFDYAALDAHYGEIEQFFARLARERPHEPVALLADLRGAGQVDARGRKRTSETFARIEPLLRERAVAHAIVSHSGLMRAALTAVLWLKTPAWPIEVFASMEDAHAWLMASFEKRGRTPPPVAPGWWNGPR